MIILQPPLFSAASWFAPSLSRGAPSALLSVGSPGLALAPMSDLAVRRRRFPPPLTASMLGTVRRGCATLPGAVPRNSAAGTAWPARCRARRRLRGTHPRIGSPTVGAPAMQIRKMERVLCASPTPHDAGCLRGSTLCTDGTVLGCRGFGCAVECCVRAVDFGGDGVGGNTSVRHGRRPARRQVRATVSLPTPWRAAMARVDQRDAPSEGATDTVSEMIAASVSALTVRGRPRPGATRPTDSKPDSANRRQRRTVLGATPKRRAIASFATPSAAANNTSA